MKKGIIAFSGEGLAINMDESGENVNLSLEVKDQFADGDEVSFLDISFVLICL